MTYLVRLVARRSTRGSDRRDRRRVPGGEPREPRPARPRPARARAEPRLPRAAGQRLPDDPHHQGHERLPRVRPAREADARRREPAQPAPRRPDRPHRRPLQRAAQDGGRRPRPARQHRADRRRGGRRPRRAHRPALGPARGRPRERAPQRSRRRRHPGGRARRPSSRRGHAGQPERARRGRRACPPTSWTLWALPPIGEVLVQAGDTTPEAVELARIEQQLGDDRKLGAILVEHGAADARSGRRRPRGAGERPPVRRRQLRPRGRRAARLPDAPGRRAGARPQPARLAGSATRRTPRRTPRSPAAPSASASSRASCRSRS